MRGAISFSGSDRSIRDKCIMSAVCGNRGGSLMSLRRRDLMQSVRKRSVLALFVMIAVFAGVLTTRAEQKPAPSRAEFMRKKLEFSKLVLEGLTLEDFTKISKGAKALQLLSEAAEWEVPTIPNAPDYVVKTRQFQDLTDELMQKAKDKNLDGSTLAYVRLTMNCIECHKYVRFKSR
jgi:hypothetical protein